MSVSLLAVVVLLAIVLLGVGACLRTSLEPLTQRPEGSVPEVASTAAAAALLERWRGRAVRWRVTLATGAALTALGASLAFRRSVDIGLGAHPPWADPLLAGLLGVFLATIAAELHHLRPRPAGPRTAQVIPREVTSYLPSGARRRRGALAGVATLAIALSLTVGDERVPWLGLVALSVLALVPTIQARIVGRARPAVAPDLLAADEMVRRLAVRSVDEAGAGAALLLIAWQLAPIYTAVDAPGPLAALMAITQLGALVIAIVWWRRSSPQRLLLHTPATTTSPQDAEASA